jgi:hypothetical protein
VRAGEEYCLDVLLFWLSVRSRSFVTDFWPLTVIRDRTAKLGPKIQMSQRLVRSIIQASSLLRRFVAVQSLCTGRLGTEMLITTTTASASRTFFPLLSWLQATQPSCSLRLCHPFVHLRLSRTRERQNPAQTSSLGQRQLIPTDQTQHVLTQHNTSAPIRSLLS